jgi:hypothetical protein
LGGWELEREVWRWDDEMGWRSYACGRFASWPIRRRIPRAL